jgi:hypothetical protein
MKSRNLRVNVIDKQDVINARIRKFLKEQGVIVYGARSINAQSNILTRDTNDWDAFSNKPKKTANKLQRILDRIVKGDYFYSKPAIHKGTFKVKGIGNDLIKDNEDDESIADFSKPDKKVRYKIINGMKYRNLKEEIRRKKITLTEPEKEFRWAKDKSDLDRIKSNIKIQRLLK